MSLVRTPCIGICSTTSLGDRICLGCKRFSFEVIAWNGYSESEKAAVLRRIDLLSEQIVASRLRILSLPQLQQVLSDFRFFYDPVRSPYAWLLSFLQKQFWRVGDLRELGVELLPPFDNKDIKEVLQEMNEELITLSEAHLERYFRA